MIWPVYSASGNIAALVAMGYQSRISSLYGSFGDALAVVLHGEGGRESGEIEMVAVDPECQSRGIGLKLVSLAVEEISWLGFPLAEIGTGGDPGHAAARRVYEKAGFTALPLVRYYKALQQTTAAKRSP